MQGQQVFLPRVAIAAMGCLLPMQEAVLPFPLG
jgi:hypothetical protein